LNKQSVSLANVRPDDGAQAVHNWFELTYAQFLVLPRVVMSEMPGEWQTKMVELLDELGETFDYWPRNDEMFYVRVGKEVQWPYEDDDGNPLEPVLSDPPEDLCNYRRPSIEHRRKKPAEVA
jgi:hypothetical protein